MSRGTLTKEFDELVGPYGIGLAINEIVIALLRDLEKRDPEFKQSGVIDKDYERAAVEASEMIGTTLAELVLNRYKLKD